MAIVVSGALRLLLFRATNATDRFLPVTKRLIHGGTSLDSETSLEFGLDRLVASIADRRLRPLPREISIDSQPLEESLEGWQRRA